ncbi:MAG: radical SAM protein [Anaerovoracaceae bacterium]
MHTAIETCGYTKKETILRFAEYVDLFLFDLKHIDPDRHFELTGVRNEMILENLEELIMKRNHVKVRMPMLKGINDSEAEIRGVIEFLKPFQRISRILKGSIFFRITSWVLTNTCSWAWITRSREIQVWMMRIWIGSKAGSGNTISRFPLSDIKQQER